MKPLWVIGSGGHASEVIENARAGEHWDPVGLLDDDADRWNQPLFGLVVSGPISRDRLVELNASYAVIAIGNNTIRSRVADLINGATQWAAVIHPTSYVAAGSSIAAGTMVGVFAVVQPGSRLDPHVIVNTSAVIGHDVTVGACAHVGPGVILAGGVQVGEGAFLGTGASVIPGVRIGAWATVGAGAVVIGDVPDGTTVVGVPAKVAKR